MSLKPSILTVGSFGNYSVSSHGMEFQDATSKSEWLEVMQKLCAMHEGAALTKERTLMLLADALNFGEHAFNEEFAQAIDGTRQALGLTPKTIANAQWAYGKIPSSLRRDGLTLGHYQVIAGLPKESQEEYVTDALTSHLTVKDLKASVAVAFPKTKRGKTRKIIQESADDEDSAFRKLDESAAWINGHPSEKLDDKWKDAAYFFYRLYRRKWLKRP